MKKNVNATRLIGGNPPSQPPGFNQPLYPIKTKCTPEKSIADRRTFRDVMKLIKSLSFRNAALKLTL